MKKILVPTDFSPIAKNAVQYTLSLAKIFQSEVIIFHAEDFPLEELASNKEEIDEKMLSHDMVDIKYMTSSRAFNSLLINEIVKENHIGLIVMATIGEDAPAEKVFFGRNATEIAEHAICPVLILPPVYKFSPIEKIVYASDLHFIDEEISKVIALAKLLGTPVEILFVSPVFPDLKDVEKMDMPKKLEEIKKKHNFTDINYSVEKTKKDNQFEKGVTEFMNRHDHDLLIMFHNHDTDFEELISTSNTEKMISGIKTPLVIYPKK